jgi:hypothetical protein
VTSATSINGHTESKPEVPGEILPPIEPEDLSLQRAEDHFTRQARRNVPRDYDEGRERIGTLVGEEPLPSCGCPAGHRMAVSRSL